MTIIREKIVSLCLDGPPIRWLNVKLKLNSAGMVGIDTQALGACKLCATGTCPKNIKFQFNTFSVRVRTDNLRNFNLRSIYDD